MQSLGKISKGLYKSVPNYTFSKLLIKKYPTFLIEQNKYIMELYPPIYMVKNKFTQLIINKRNLVKFVDSSYYEDLSCKIPQYNSKVNFQFNGYLVDEIMEYSPDFENKWMYQVTVITPLKDTLVYSKLSQNNFLISHNVPNIIQTLYYEVEKKLK